MPNQLISAITVPVNVGGTITDVTFDIKDAYARQAIADLGNSMYWLGVTTTTLTDGATTNPIVVGGADITAQVGAVAQYSGEEFAWNGTSWQSLGKNNFGSLAFKNSATGSYTPAGSVSTTPTTSNINGISTVGTLPTYTVSGETLTVTAGTLPTKASTVAAVTGVTASFTGTAATISVS